MEFKTYGTKARIESNGDVYITQDFCGDEITVSLSPMEAKMLIVWIEEALRVREVVNG